jgi:hypothetical protein
VWDENQFATSMVNVRAANWLCVPSAKKVIGKPQPSGAGWPGLLPPATRSRRSGQGARLYRPPDSVATNRVPWAKTGWAKTLFAPTGNVVRIAPVAALTR